MSQKYILLPFKLNLVLEKLASEMREERKLEAHGLEKNK